MTEHAPRFWKAVLPRAIGLLALVALWAYSLGLQLSGFAAVTFAVFGISVGIYATWYDYRPPGGFIWVRLVGGLFLLALNFAAIIVAVRGYRFDLARLILPGALFADTFIAGMIFGSATAELIVLWWRRRQDAKRIA